MMHYSRYKISDFVDFGSALIQVATKDSAIRRGMAEVGYGTQKLSDGEILYRKFHSLTLEHESTTRQKRLVNNQRSQNHLLLKKEYMRVVKIARIAFQDQNVILTNLCLDAEREKVMDSWIAQGELFCKRLLTQSEYLSALLPYGISETMVQELVVKFNELRSISVRKSEIESNLLLLTKQKRNSMVAFQRWLSDYLKIARIRFDEEPALLSHLKIK